YVLSTRPATRYPYGLSLHEALPIWSSWAGVMPAVGVVPAVETRLMPTVTCWEVGTVTLGVVAGATVPTSQQVTVGINREARVHGDRKSTRLNSSHVKISYAVFCLKK